MESLCPEEKEPVLLRMERQEVRHHHSLPGITCSWESEPLHTQGHSSVPRSHTELLCPGTHRCENT